MSENCVETDVSIDFDALEKELDSSDWSRGWEKGREDTLRAMRESMFPSDDRILKSAEMMYKIMVQNFGNVFAKIFAGFNNSYDEPSILLCLKADAKISRADVCWYGSVATGIFNESGMLPINVVVTREESIDIDAVRKDFKFERSL